MVIDRSAARAASGMLETVLSLLRADAPEQIMNAPQDWPRWALLLPHVLAATSHFGTLSSQAPRGAGADASWLLGSAATYLQIHARFGDARPLAERALAIDEAAYGTDVATRLNNLALILSGLGQSAEARPLAERAVAIAEAAYGPGHPDVATLRTNLAAILADLAQPDDTGRRLAIDEAPGAGQRSDRPEGNADDRA